MPQFCVQISCTGSQFPILSPKKYDNNIQFFIGLAVNDGALRVHRARTRASGSNAEPRQGLSRFPGYNRAASVV